MCRIRPCLMAGLALLVSGSALAGAPASPTPPAAEGLPVECLRVGEGSVTGRLASIHGGTVTLLRDGMAEAFPLDAFREIVSLQAGSAPSRLPPPWTVWADGGAVWTTRQVSGGNAPETVSMVGYGWEGADVPLAWVRALASREVLRAAAADREEFEKLRESPPPASDLVMVAGSEGARVLSCIVEGATDAGLSIALGGAQSTLPWGEVRWAVLSPGAGPKEEAAGHMLELADGTRIRARSLDLEGATLTAQDGPARYVVNAAGPNPLVRLRVHSDSYRYLGDLEPEKVALRPLLDVVWPPLMDRAVSGGPITLSGKSYPKGIGMHARTEMTFRLGAAYSRFYALVGVDDSGKAAAGQAAFRALADGRLLYDGGALTAGDAPRPLCLNVTGVQRLTLVADFASPVAAAGCFADWAEARVVR